MPTVKPVSDLKNNIEVLESTIQLLIHLEQGETSAHENGWAFCRSGRNAPESIIFRL